MIFESHAGYIGTTLEWRLVRFHVQLRLIMFYKSVTERISVLNGTILVYFSLINHRQINKTIQTKM